ncbi:MAG: chemotaxis protein CheW [Pseudomonadota bacterium]
MDDLIDDFISETSEALDFLDRELVTLADTPDNQTALAAIARLVHTIKSTCGFLGLPRLEAVAHGCEQLLTSIRNGEVAVTADTTALLLESMQRIKAIIAHLAEHRREPEGDDAAFLAHLAQPGKARVLTAPEPVQETLPESRTIATVVPSIPKPDLSDAIKRKAIRQGLDTVTKEQDTAPTGVALPAPVLASMVQQVGELSQLRHQLSAIARQRADRELDTIAQQLAHLTAGLQESVMQGCVQPSIPVLLVECAGQIFAIPQIHVGGLMYVGIGAEHRIEQINAVAALRLHDRLLPLVTLRDRLQLPATLGDSVVLLQAGSTEFGLIVDRVCDTMQVMATPLSPLLAGITAYGGATILGDGTIALILDPRGLAPQLREIDLSAPRLPAVQALPLTPLAGEKQTRFLLFRDGAAAPMAVPLDGVARLEIIAAETVERSGGESVVQYRGELMRLRRLPPRPLPTHGTFEVIVFAHGERLVGLVVDAIADIVEAPSRLRITAAQGHLLGSTVIAGKVTDIVDAASLFEHAPAFAEEGAL